MSISDDSSEDTYLEMLSTWCHAVNDYFEKKQGGSSRVTNDNRMMINLAKKNRDLKYLKAIRKEDKVMIREFTEWDFTPLDNHLRETIGVGLDWTE